MSYRSTLLATPNNVARLFSLDGAQAPKQRHVFLVRFVRPGDTTGKSILTFLVKSADRPSVQITTEELNQYNKKRQVYTGWKAQPIKVSFFDTADGAALRFWDNYSRHFFGDFNQKPSGWQYDVTTPQFQDGGSGFGFTAANGGDTGLNAQFVLSQIEIIHVGGVGFSRIILVNPRITTFDPDDLDYENSGVSTINATFAYEAVLYDGGGVSDTERDLFGSAFDATNISDEVAGIMPNPVGQRPPMIEDWAATRSSSIGQFPLGIGVQGQSSQFTGNVSSTSGGILNSFGSFNFGRVAGSVAASLVSGRGLRAGLNEGLPYLAPGNPLISAITTLSGSRSPVTSIGSALLGSFGRPSSGISAALWDAAQGGLQGGVRGQRGALEGLARGGATSVVSGLIGGSVLTGNGNVGNRSQGLVPTATAMDITNASRPASAQYGFNVNALSPAQRQLREQADQFRPQARSAGYLSEGQ